MWEKLLSELWGKHRGKLVGALVGLGLSLLILKYGLFGAVFILVCVLVGYFVGKRVDEGEDFWGVVDRYLPSGRRRNHE